MHPLPLMALLLLGATGLSAYASVKVAVNGPSLSLTASAPLVARAGAVPAFYVPPAAGPNSLWRVGGRAFFIDQRAARIGDIVTASVPHFLGLKNTLGRILPGGFDPETAVETASNSTNAGAGSVTRAEKINLTIAAIVTSVPLNGNLFIQGNQEVWTNAELRQLTVSGIVRPEDISSTSTVRHTQIAEARISYGGRGDISQAQKTPGGQVLV